MVFRDLPVTAMSPVSGELQNPPHQHHRHPTNCLQPPPALLLELPAAAFVDKPGGWESLGLCAPDLGVPAAAAAAAAVGLMPAAAPENGLWHLIFALAAAPAPAQQKGSKVMRDKGDKGKDVCGQLKERVTKPGSKKKTNSVREEES